MAISSVDRPAAVLEQCWQLHSSVSIRPEPFGALVYHFGTRRLSFLKSRQLLDVVNLLSDHADARSACVAAGVADAELPSYAQALAVLARSELIVPRTSEVTA